MINSGFTKLGGKLNIIAYYDRAFSNNAGLKYEATINPESYSSAHKVEYCDTQAPGTSMPILKFNKIVAQEMNFDFLFDSTGVIKDALVLTAAIANPFEKTKSVGDQIEDFKKTVINYEGKIHQPYFLRILWGTLIFNCVLTSLDIEYKLFKPDGTPIRAVAKCSFKEIIEEDLRQKLEKKQSPDVTHERTIKSGDRLSLITYKIYNNQRNLLYVAAFNRLDGFRNIEKGSKIYFPPQQK